MSGRNRRGRDAMGLGLAALNKLAGSTAIDRLRLRKPTERAAYEASRVGLPGPRRDQPRLRRGAEARARPSARRPRTGAICST